MPELGGRPYPRWIFGQTAIGLPLGLLLFYTTAMLSSIARQSEGNANLYSALLLALLCISVVSVLIGRLRPLVGISGGGVVLLIVVLGLALGFANAVIRVESWADVGAIWSHGSGTPVAAVIGMTAVVSGLIEAATQRNHERDKASRSR